MLSAVDEVREVLVNDSQYLLLVGLGGHLHLLVVVVGCVLQHEIVVVLLPLLVGEVINVHAHRLQFLPLELDDLFRVLLLHLFEEL